MPTVVDNTLLTVLVYAVESSRAHPVGARSPRNLGANSTLAEALIARLGCVFQQSVDEGI